MAWSNRVRGGALVALALGAIVSGCGGAPRGSEELLVFAASSLTDSFAAITEAFELSHPDISVSLNFAASSTLRSQLVEGAPADVFASADEATMDALRAEVATERPFVFAANAMTIAVPAGNPAGVSGLADFANPSLAIGLCAEPVPCGALARVALQRAGVAASIDTDEPNVRALLAKIAAGELDAGIVYATDAAAPASGVDAVPIPPEVDVSTRYSIAQLVDAHHPEAAAMFVEFVVSAEGRRVLDSFGFVAP